MRASYSTREAAPAMRRMLWQDAVAHTYFPLDLNFGGGSDFSGSLDAWSLGATSLSRLVCSRLLYVRNERHLASEREESYLITVPEVGEFRFEQDGRDVRCRPGAFVIERSHLPYEFGHRDPTSLWVMKVPSAVLRSRISRPERLAALQIGAGRSVGALFVDMLRLTAGRIDEMDDPGRRLLGKQLVDLLAMAIEADERVLVGQSSSVRNAHLHRCEHFIRSKLGDGRLSPLMVAEACGISLRYLHQIFEAEGTTVCAYIRSQRLLACDAMLRDPNCRKTMSEIAYEWGFGDQAQFSRHYRARFGRTPSDARAAARGV